MKKNGLQHPGRRRSPECTPLSSSNLRGRTKHVDGRARSTRHAGRKGGQSQVHIQGHNFPGCFVKPSRLLSLILQSLSSHLLRSQIYSIYPRLIVPQNRGIYPPPQTPSQARPDIRLSNYVVPSFPANTKYLGIELDTFAVSSFLFHAAQPSASAREDPSLPVHPTALLHFGLEWGAVPKGLVGVGPHSWKTSWRKLGAEHPPMWSSNFSSSLLMPRLQPTIPMYHLKCFNWPVSPESALGATYLFNLTSMPWPKRCLKLRQ